jgi:hypothetical protein
LLHSFLHFAFFDQFESSKISIGKKLRELISVKKRKVNDLR